jgi:Domain of unknown function (DUF4333)
VAVAASGFEAEQKSCHHCARGRLCGAAARVGLIVFVVLTGFLSSIGDLQGTAPQVVTGQTYPGGLLQDEVTRVISGDGGEVGSMTCPETANVDAGAATLCQGVVDGFPSEVTITFEDGLGHFTLLEN